MVNETRGERHLRLKGAVLGGVAGQLLGDYAAALLVLLAPSNIDLGIPHPLLLLLIIGIPVPIGCALGWWQAATVVRYGGRVLDYFSARWIRFP
jgi:hypothetical protein